MAWHYLDSCREDFRGWEHNYLYTLFNQNHAPSRGTPAQVSAWPSARTASGSLSGSEDKTVKVWDAATGQEMLTLKGHTVAVSSVAFSPDGKRIVTGSRDKTVKVWDAATGQEMLTLKGHTD